MFNKRSPKLTFEALAPASASSDQQKRRSGIHRPFCFSPYDARNNRSRIVSQTFGPEPCADNLYAVSQAGLVKYATYAASDGGDFESEALGYFLIRESSSDEPGYLVLPGGQFVQLLPDNRNEPCPQSYACYPQNKRSVWNKK